MGADFNIESFKHLPVWDRENSQMVSYIVSETDQTVTIGELGLQVNFKKGEQIKTEVSRKYSQDTISKMADQSGFEVVENYTNTEGNFIDSLWKAT